MPNYAIIEINDIADRDQLYSETDEHGSKIVKLKELSAAVRREASKHKSGAIIVGHLVPDLDIRPDIIVVIRADLDVLISRMQKRGYPKEKIHENLISEVVDYCGANCAEKCPELYEVESDLEKARMLEYLSQISKGKKATPPKRREIDKLEQLLDIVGVENPYGL